MSFKDASARADLLLSIARHALEAEVAGKTPKRIDLAELPEDFSEHRACFVTLRIDEALRGCIGSVEATRPLAFEVAEQARAAGTRDSRFPPLSLDELSNTRIEISVLSLPEPLSLRSRHELLECLVPDIDGLILQDGNARAVYLPSVWEQLPDPEEFVGELLVKAGLAKDHWSEDLIFSRFHTDSIREDTPV